jgi:hypothetical protein
MDTALVLDALEHAVFTRRQAGITDLTGGCRYGPLTTGVTD